MRHIHFILNCLLPFILLLFYETGSTPVKFAADWNSTPQIDSKSQVPVWARKAGFHMKPSKPDSATLTTTSTGSTPPSSNLDQKDEGVIMQDNSILPGNVGVVQQNLEVSESENGSQERNKEDEKDQEVETEDEGYEEGSDETTECPEDQFWHIRGHRCVPVVCPGGNSWRDVQTGECILRHFRKKKYNRRFSIPSRHMTGLANGYWVSG